MNVYNVLDADGNLLGVLPRSFRDVGLAAELRSFSGVRAAAIPAGAEFTVPAYVVGGAQLEVYLDGAACMQGGQYSEVGETDAPSDKIIWNIEISTDRDILVRSK